MTQEGGSAGRTGEAERQRLAPVEVKVVNSHPDSLINWLSVAGICQSLVITGTADTQVGLRLSDNDVVTLTASEALQVLVSMQVFLSWVYKANWALKDTIRAASGTALVAIDHRHCC